MYNHDKVIKITMSILVFFEGVVGISSALARASAPVERIIMWFAIWFVFLIALTLIGVKNERRIRVFIFLAVLATTALSVYISLLFKNTYLFVCLSFMLWICNIPGLRKNVFLSLTVIDIIVVAIPALFFKVIPVHELIFIIFCYVFACWISFIFSNRTARLGRMIADQNNSYDDMIDLIEARFMEEKNANHEKSVFLANVSHEIRTPINAILGLNTMTLRECGEDNIREYARDINNAGQTLLALINDILDISKIESGKMDIVPVEYNLAYLISDVVNMISFKVNAKDLKLNVNVDESLPSVLFGDDVRIRQVLINIMNNAVKYTEKGSITLNVSGSTSDGNARIRFEVCDTGIGIREEDMNKLFNKFERLDTVRNRNIEGTGLGLIITNMLITLMGAKLDVKSTYGEGSVFAFTLTQRIINDTPVGKNMRQSVAEAGKEPAAGFIAPDANILVVDDNKTNRLVFTKLLKRIKPHIDEADGGKKALELTRHNKYDIIFLDHMMPGMDGIETLHAMKEDLENINSCPVIALTANAISGSREKYLSAGFDDYLSKPIDPYKLEELIFSLLPDDKKQKQHING